MSADRPTPPVIDTTAATFEADVMARSREIPVVVDFWAPWCGPCRALGPILEKLAEEHHGEFVLVKANTDELPEVAFRFNVSGIPAVFAVVDGQIIEFFSGALPEPMVREWLQRVLDAGRLKSVARLEESAPAEAAAKYREILAADPGQLEAKLGLARVLLALGEHDECAALIKELDDRGFLDAEGQKIKATLELHKKPHGDVAARRAAAQANPDDLSLQYQLAEALAGAEQYEEALDLLLTIFQRDKKGIGQQVRELMVQIFQALPSDSELAATYRRKLSMAMY